MGLIEIGNVPTAILHHDAAPAEIDIDKNTIILDDANVHAVEEVIVANDVTVKLIHAHVADDLAVGLIVDEEPIILLRVGDVSVEVDDAILGHLGETVQHSDDEDGRVIVKHAMSFQNQPVTCRGLRRRRSSGNPRSTCRPPWAGRCACRAQHAFRASSPYRHRSSWPTAIRSPCRIGNLR